MARTSRQTPIPLLSGGRASSTATSGRSAGTFSIMPRRLFSASAHLEQPFGGAVVLQGAESAIVARRLDPPVGKGYGDGADDLQPVGGTACGDLGGYLAGDPAQGE